MKPRYVLHPGPVPSSRGDGGQHFVTASQLALLYHVSMDDCVVYQKGMRLDEPGDIHLFPRSNGVYLLSGIVFEPITDRKVI